MAWTVVETKNAKYVLVFGSHDGLASEVSPIKPDALVIETGMVGQEDFYKFLIESHQHARLLNQAFQSKAEVWFTDVPPTKKSLERMERGKSGLQIFSGITGLSASAGYYYLKQFSEKRKAVNQKRVPRKISRRDLFRMFIFGVIGFLAPSRLLAYEQRHVRIHEEQIVHEKYWHTMAKVGELMSGKGIVGIRNAITAEKSDSFLAPRLHAKLNKKPVIVMLWGSDHFGIKELLESPEKRRAILRENKIEEFVEKGYPKSFRVKIPEKMDQKIEFEEFPETLRPKKPKEEARLSRRGLLRRLFARRRRA